MEYNINNLDEKSYQMWFYQLLFGDNWENKVWIDRNTDGHTAGILFEHKKNISSYGMAKALSQADTGASLVTVKYLCTRVSQL